MWLCLAVVGRPNVGKSTLINAIVERRSPSRVKLRPQDRVLGVVTYDDAQLVFVDTPGFQLRYSSQ